MIFSLSIIVLNDVISYELNVDKRYYFQMPQLLLSFKLVVNYRKISSSQSFKWYIVILYKTIMINSVA